MSLTAPLPIWSPTGPRPRAAPRRRRVAALVVLALIGVIVAFNAGQLLGIVALFVLVVPFEKLFPRHDQRLRRPGLGTDLAYGISAPVLTAAGGLVGGVIGVLCLAWVPGLALRPVVTALPDVIRIVTGILLFDLAGYWVHRWIHEVPFLWRFHKIHHSSARLDWISGARGHPLDGAIVAAPFVFLFAAGFSLALTGALLVVQLVIGLFLHANVNWRWAPLHRVVITPEFHHWHHANERDAHNSNYSGFLPLWDLLFGTYFMPKQRRPQVYGVSEPVPAGLLAQLWHPFRGLRNPLREMRHPILATRHAAAALRRGVGQIHQVTCRRSAVGAA